MWRSKKFIIIALLAAVVLVGSIGGIAFAQTETGDDSHPGAVFGALWDRVSEIYKDNTGDEIDAVALKDALAQARNEMRTEAREDHLAKMIENGVIDETQAQELQDWWESKPDMPDGLGFGGLGRFHGMGGMHGFGGLCAPAAE